MNVYLGSDHTGFEFKEKLKVFLDEIGYVPVDKGAFGYDPGDDYPDFIAPVAFAVAKEEGSMGIILGGSGQGEAMCANRVSGARTALFYGPKVPITEVDISGKKSTDAYELIRLAREHNNANILSIGMRFVSEDEAKFAIRLFLATKFEGEDRHVRRINKIEEWQK